MNPIKTLTRMTALVLSCGMCFVAPTAAWAQPTDTPSAASSQFVPADAEARVPDEAVYRQHIMTLSNPYFEGRAPGTRGNRDAADYIEFTFKRYGLIPAFPTNGKAFSTYFQPFTPAGLRDGKTTIAAQSVSIGGKALEAEVDFHAIGMSGNGAAEGPIVFVGYSLPDGNDGYTSFANEVDLKGKIALILRFEPMTEEGKSKWSDAGWSPHSALSGKVAQAAKRGAAGVIVVNPPGAKDDRAGRLATLAETLANSEQQNIPVVMVSTAIVDAMVRGDGSGKSLEDLRKMADEKGVVIDLPKATAKISTELKRETVLTDNVGGILRGKGALADEYVVIGSHYDHVGYGEFGSLSNSRGIIHPGADDNASGTSGNLTLAKKFSEVYAKLPENANCRSILFLGFSGEESGLEGSRFYTKNMIVPREKHYVMLNLDMIGRLRDAPPLEITGVGSAPGLEEWLKPYFDNAGFPTVAKKRAPSNSDHASFYNAKVPIAFFFTGLHADYHRPSDTADKINVEGAAKIVDLVFRIATDATTRTVPLVFGEPQAPAATAAPKPEATNPHAPVGDQPLPAAGGGVRFGVMPADYSDQVAGVLIGEVFADTPAAKGGLKAGDRITKWNGKAIKDVEEWSALLRAGKVGDKVEITYTRASKDATCTVVLEARKGG